jgi:hypothetical protein
MEKSNLAVELLERLLQGMIKAQTREEWSGDTLVPNFAFQRLKKRQECRYSL